MYNELYASWQQETEHPELGRLPSDFYARLAKYLHILNDAGEAIDEKSIKKNLLAHEAANAKRLVNELIAARYNKIVQLLLSTKTVPSEVLAFEEVTLCSNLSSSTDQYNQFVTSLLAGQDVKMSEDSPPKVEAAKNELPKTNHNPTPTVVAPTPITPSVQMDTHKRVTMRFLKIVPAIVGSDMKTYGSFMVEDVASVPESNAKILVRQGLAKLVEIP